VQQLSVDREDWLNVSAIGAGLTIRDKVKGNMSATLTSESTAIFSDLEN